jgi:signal transduction histidine kinase
MVRACVLPTAAMALLGCATVWFLKLGEPSVTATRMVLLAAAAGAALILAAAYVGAAAAIRPVHDQIQGLRSLHARGLDELRHVVEGARRGDRDERGERGGPPAIGAPPPTSDPFELLAYDVRRTHLVARQAVLDAANLVSGPDQRVEVFVNLALRMQSLVHREIQLLDELEAQVEDPDLLKGLFTVDHLATLLRRQTESLAVLGGAASRRRWSNPVTMYDVLRSAVAEVEQYSRVKLVLPIEGMLLGDAVAHIIHLVAELVENATKFSPPETQVLIRAENVTAGLAIEVEDRGLGIPADDRRRMNDVLAEPGQVNIGELLRDGRIGLFVVSALARRHGVKVELHRNVYGGTQAVVVLPPNLVQPMAHDRPKRAAVGPSAPVSAAAGSPVPVPVAAGPSGPVSVAAGPSGPVSAAAGPRPALPPRGADGHEGAGDDRPPLPQRRVQQNLSPQLREAPATRDDEPTVEPTPDLMAGFLRGVSRSDEEEDDHPVDGSGGTR